VNVAPPDGPPARGAARSLLEALGQGLADASGRAPALWFVRKKPGIRIRIRDLGPALSRGDALSGLMGRLAKAGLAGHWFMSEYEPETNALGGDAAADAAHQLFVDTTEAWLELDRAIASGQCKLAPSVVCMATLNELFQKTLEDDAEVWDTWRELDRRYRSFADAGDRAPRLSLAQVSRAGISEVAVRMRAAVASYAGALSDEWRAGRLSRGGRGVLRTVAAFYWNINGISVADIGRTCRAMEQAWHPDAEPMEAAR
jgi:thiopeptide-type bacteriocin biosynthesis protein